ncbi:MAG: hypothetical protein MI923_11850 [Phycisphaerales bacterium]|nr:hypothetical protein [Phycisphaerales bacterium]
MPILEFYCPNCDEVFEELVRSSQKKSSIACPTCKNKQVSRQVSVFSARGASAEKAASVPSACGRCGDPNGPCAS